MLLLFVALTSLASLLPERGLFQADEGAVLAQLHTLEATGELLVPWPSGVKETPVFGLSAETDAGVAPYAKHLSYIALAWPFHSVAGRDGVVMLSVLGAVGTAAAAATLAGALHGRQRGVFWIVGLGSPITVYALTSTAHTLSAAACAWATVALVVGARRSGPAWLHAIAAASGFFVGAMLRNEAVLLSVAIGVVLVGGGLRRRSLSQLVLASGAPLGGILAYVIDPRLTATALGSNSRVFRIADADPRNGLAEWAFGRLEGAVTVLIAPAIGPTLGSFLVLLVAVGVAVSALEVAAPRRGRVAIAVAATGTLAAAGLVIVEYAEPVPGLFLAMPVALYGVVASVEDRGFAVSPDGRRLLFACGIFATAVLLLQYSGAGSREWGGRYLLVGLPLAVAVLAPPLVDLLRQRLESRSLAALMLLSVMAIQGVGVLSVDRGRRTTAMIVDRVVSIQEETGAEVVLFTDGLGSRAAWAQAVNLGWAYVSDDALTEALLSFDSRGKEVLVVFRSNSTFGLLLEAGVEGDEMRALGRFGGSMGSWFALLPQHTPVGAP